MEDEIRRYIGKGYRLTARTETTAHLIRPKTFSTFWAIMWFLLCGVGVLVYVFHYMGKQDDVVYLSIDDQGAVQRIGDHPAYQRARPAVSRSLAPTSWVCPKCGRPSAEEFFDCTACGTRQRCPKCGQRTIDNITDCTRCGARRPT